MKRTSEIVSVYTSTIDYEDNMPSTVLAHVRTFNDENDSSPLQTVRFIATADGIMFDEATTLLQYKKPIRALIASEPEELSFLLSRCERLKVMRDSPLVSSLNEGAL